jgi:hypothetical protein
VDANSKPVMDTPVGYSGRWDLVATEVLKRLSFGGDAPVEVEALTGLPFDSGEGEEEEESWDL